MKPFCLTAALISLLIVILAGCDSASTTTIDDSKISQKDNSKARLASGQPTQSKEFDSLLGSWRNADGMLLLSGDQAESKGWYKGSWTADGDPMNFSWQLGKALTASDQQQYRIEQLLANDREARKQVDEKWMPATGAIYIQAPPFFATFFFTNIQDRELRLTRKKEHVPADGILATHSDLSDAFDFSGQFEKYSLEADAFARLGLSEYEKGNLQEAIANFDKAIGVDAQHFEAHLQRGMAWREQGNFAQAFTDFREAVRINSNDAWGYTVLSWNLATCPDAKFRDGTQAINYAKKACELTGWSDVQSLDSLAAAYAEAGDFDQAVDVQKKAIRLAKQEDVAELESRLELYISESPYRQEFQ